ncbi:MAG: hypothetical protein AUG51_07575 [Acidobacteria bacterium 13_1_20CM_3_53_8]|nr:MAG: hypothetical protein AUG51_07575 [Acidobacteria bacterium 13_1_20CM_3_53_8]
MLRASFALLLLIVFPLALYAQTSTQTRELQLTAKIIGQKFCAGSGGVDVLHLKLRLNYRNAGAQKLILYRGNNLFFQVWVSSNLNQPSYQMMTTGSRYLQLGPENLDRPSLGRDFVLLSPKENFETELTVSLPVVRESAPIPVGAIIAGEHLLKIGVSTWYESRQLGERLRERWRRTGLLWTTPVTSAPVQFSSGSYSSSGC